MQTTSQLRKRLLQLAEEIPALLPCVFESSPLWRGQVHDAKRKCGKPNCRCTRGELHVSTVLADRSGSRLRNLSLPGKTLALFAKMTEEYRLVRKTRARFVKITKEMLSLLDRLEEVRRELALKRHGGKLPPPREKGNTS
jgi:hypothetical protein